MAVSAGDSPLELETSWTYWFDHAARGSSYDQRLQRLGAFSTAQDFWAFYCHLARPSSMRAGDNYHMMRGVTAPAIEVERPP